ncbi:DUF3180 domain-containing protein [Jonesia quinghaiensis]|uniref:DUF3180 domain-containing protein n=1 Tax=Jonesia quinghaiensis TaxID=262806 RepID=UPI000411E0F0|nr:DUF3180 domain-containing protein [Jonesia quinghaiensis]
MTRSRISQLISLSVLSLGGTWGILLLLRRYGMHVPAVTVLQILVIVGLAVGVTWAGLTVRAYLAGKKPKLSGLAAARIAVFAKATCLGGALFVGWYGGQLLLTLENLGIESQAHRAWFAGAAVIASLVLCICGYIAEGNCQIPPEDDGDTEKARPRGTIPEV